MAQVEEHTKSYDVDIIKSQLATGIEKKELIEVTLANGAVLKSKTAILALGANGVISTFLARKNSAIKVLLTAHTVMVHYLKDRMLQLSVVVTQVWKRL